MTFPPKLQTETKLKRSRCKKYIKHNANHLIFQKKTVFFLILRCVKKTHKLLNKTSNSKPLRSGGNT